MSSMFPDTDRERTQTSDASEGNSQENTRVQQAASSQEMEESQTPWPRIPRGIESIYGLIQETNRREGFCSSYWGKEEYQNITNFLCKYTRFSLDRIYSLYYRPEYKIYKIRQGKRGKLRTIEEPHEDLKRIQRALIEIFEQVQLHPACTSRKGYSAVENAIRHRNAKHLLKIDIKNCYATTDGEMILRAFKALLNPEDLSIARLAIWWCMIYTRDYARYMLPTGAPSSPILCNIALTPVDISVKGALNRGYPDKYVYTRYLDDLIISTTHDVRDWEVKKIVEDIIRRGGWQINTKKSKWFTSNESDKPTVTGVRIGDTYGVPREFHRKVRARLQNLAKEKLDIDAETQGCLAYIQSVDPKRHSQLLTYYYRRMEYGGPDGKCPNT